MKPGEFICKFKTRKGKKALLRASKLEDAKDFVRIFNSVVSEDQYITLTEKTDLNEEKKYIKEKVLPKMEKNERIHIVCVIDNKAVGVGEMERGQGRQTHVGELSIVIEKKYRNEGIGSKILKELLKIAKKIGIKVLLIDVFATNKRACYVYKKMGFKEYGKIRKGAKLKNKYIDLIKMQYRGIL